MTKKTVYPEVALEAIDVLTVREVAEYLRLSESTVYRLVQDGEIPGRKIGGTWRFSKQSLDEWLIGSTYIAKDFNQKEI